MQDIIHHLSTTATASTSNNTDGKYIDDDDVHNTTGWEHILIESLSDIYIPTYNDNNNNTNTSDGLQQEANKKFAYFMITPFAPFTPAAATELMSSLLTVNTTTTTVKSSSTPSSTPSIIIFILQCFCRYVYMYCMYLYILN